MLLYISCRFRDLHSCLQDFFQKRGGFYIYQLSRSTSYGLDRLPEPCSSSAKLFHALSRVQARKIGRHDEHINIAAIFGLTTGMRTKQYCPVNADVYRAELGAIA